MHFAVNKKQMCGTVAPTVFFKLFPCIFPAAKHKEGAKESQVRRHRSTVRGTVPHVGLSNLLA
jgi:hypothetical protein